MPAMHGDVQCAVRGRMQAVEESYRLYNCRHCAQQVRLCRRCDRGQRYCPDGCAPKSRRESLRRAGKRYQLSYRGACRHAARQHAWRERQAQKVTHQGSLPPVLASTVAAIAKATTSEGTDADTAAVYFHQPPQSDRSRPCCSGCGRLLPAFARVGWLQRGGP